MKIFFMFVLCLDLLAFFFVCVPAPSQHGKQMDALTTVPARHICTQYGHTIAILILCRKNVQGNSHDVGWLVGCFDNSGRVVVGVTTQDDDVFEAW